jgi:hypothetical protein
MSTLSVSFPFRDKHGEYEVSAYVHNNSKVTIWNICTEDRQSADINDWTSDEQSLMRGLAIKASKELDTPDEEEYDTDILNDEEWERE